MGSRYQQRLARERQTFSFVYFWHKDYVGFLFLLLWLLVVILIQLVSLPQDLSLQFLFNACVCVWRGGEEKGRYTYVRCMWTVSLTGLGLGQVVFLLK